MSYLILALIKVLDNIILTAKSIATYKEKRIISSFFVIMSQLIFYLVINQVISDNTILSIVIVSVSSGIGNYIAFLINDRFKKDDKWSMVITCSDVEDITNLCNYLTKNKIKHIANKGYTRKGNDTIHVIVFSKTKDESRKIDSFIENSHVNYLVERI